MPKILNQVFSNLEVELAELKDENLDIFDQAAIAIKKIEYTRLIIEEKLKDYMFASKEDEINYFKYYYPKIFRVRYYYDSIVLIEKEKYSRCFTKLEEVEFYKNYINQINQLLDDEIILLNESNELSFKNRKKNFLRKHYKWRRKYLRLAINENYVINSISIAIGKKESRVDLIAYIEDKIKGLQDPQVKDKPKLKWTASKALLMELIYALFLVGCFNDGKAELQEIVRFFSDALGIDLSNHTSIIQNIKSRKINKTVFIDKLREQLNIKLLD